MEALKPDAQRLSVGPALGPGIIAATSFALSDTLAKFVFVAGGDVLTLALIRGVIGLGIMFVYLRLDPPLKPSTPRVRLIALGARRAVCRGRLWTLQGDRTDHGPDRGADLFRLSALDRHRRLHVRYRAAVMAGRARRAGRLPRSGADDRRLSAAALGARHRVCARRCGVARGISPGCARRTAGGRSAPDHVAFAGVLDGDFRGCRCRSR